MEHSVHITPPPVLETLPGAVAVLDATGVIVYTNAAWRASTRQWKGSAERLVVGSNLFDQPETITESTVVPFAELTACVRPALNGAPLPVPVDLRFATEPHPTWKRVRVSTYTESGARFIVIDLTDITDLKCSEGNEDPVVRMDRGLFTSATGAMVLVDVHGEVVESNNAFAETFGCAAADFRSPDRVRLRRFIRRDGSEFPPYERPALVALRTRKPVLDVEVGIAFDDGQLRWFIVSARPLLDAAGEPLGATVTFVDVTHRTQVEDALRESERRFRLLFDSMDEAAALFEVIVDEQGVPVDFLILAANKSYGHHVGKTASDVVGRRLREVFQDLSPEAVGRYATVALKGTSVSHEFFSAAIQRHVRVKGYSPCYGQVALVFEDITERKEEEGRIMALLKEKELLLREVHHRIKNNMAVITSMLSLQRGMLKDETAREALRSSEQRVASMMILYDRLYRSAVVSELSARSYLEPLLQAILTNFDESSKVTLRTAIEDVELSADQLSHLGILLNELVSNSMKYAFTGRERGTIAVACGEHNGRVTLTVHDDGVGIPQDVNLTRPESFGLRLASILAEQLEGELTVEGRHGTTWRLEFLRQKGS